MAIAIVASANAAGSASVPQATTGINTTGASLLVVMIGGYPDSGAGVSSGGMSDLIGGAASGNTWTALTAQALGGFSIFGQMYYAANPNVGANHTFLATGNYYQGLTVLAFSGVTTTSPLGSQSGNTNSNTTIQPGSVTPISVGDLVVTGLAANNTNSNTIDSGFASPPTQTVTYSSGNSIASDITYLVVGSTSALNPTWTNGSSNQLATTIATFKAAAGGGGSIFNPRRLRAGIG